MAWLQSLRRRLRVRVVHGTSAGFRDGDLLLVNVPGYMAEEQVRALWNAMKSNFPNLSFQLLVGTRVGVTVVQGACCHCARGTSEDADDQGGRDKPGESVSDAVTSAPEAGAATGVPAGFVWTVDITPKELGDSIKPCGQRSSGKAVGTDTARVGIATSAVVEEGV